MPQNLTILWRYVIFVLPLVLRIAVNGNINIFSYVALKVRSEGGRFWSDFTLVLLDFFGLLLSSRFVAQKKDK